MLTFVGHARLILRLLHSLADLIHIGEHLLLFLLQPLEPTLDLFAFLLGFRLLQRGLELLQALIEVLLAPRKFLQAVGHRELFAAFLVLRCFRLALCFVAVLGLLQIELIELTLVLLAAAAATFLTTLPAIHRGFARLQLQQ